MTRRRTVIRNPAKMWYPRDIIGVVQLLFTVGTVVWAAAKLASGQDAVIATLKDQQEATRMLSAEVGHLTETVVRLDQAMADDRRDIDGLKSARHP